MGSWNKILRMYKKVHQLAGEPKFILLTPREWNKRFKRAQVGSRISGRCDLRGTLTIRYTHIYNLHEIEDTIWHEFLHILLPSKRHWWIECAAQKLAHNKNRGLFATRYKKHMRDVPDIKTLLRHINNASARFNANH